MVLFFDKNSRISAQVISHIQAKDGCRVILDQRGELLSMEVEVNSQAYDFWKGYGRAVDQYSVCLFVSCSMFFDPHMSMSDFRDSLRILDEACEHKTSFSEKNAMEFVQISPEVLDSAIQAMRKHVVSALCKMRLHVVYQNCSFSFLLYSLACSGSKS